MSNQDRLLSDEELLQQIRKVFRTRIHKFDTKTVTIEQTPETRNKQFIIAPYDMTAEKLLDLINTQKRLYAESIIGEDEIQPSLYSDDPELFGNEIDLPVITRNQHREEQREILKQHGWKG